MPIISQSELNKCPWKLRGLVVKEDKYSGARGDEMHVSLLLPPLDNQPGAFGPRVGQKENE